MANDLPLGIRNKFVANYFNGTKAFIKENWKMIQQAAGLSALRTWLLVRHYYTHVHRRPPDGDLDSLCEQFLTTFGGGLDHPILSDSHEQQANITCRNWHLDSELTCTIYMMTIQHCNCTSVIVELLP